MPRAALVATAAALGLALMTMTRKAQANFGNVAAISTKGLALIKGFEGFESKAYRDQAGHLTIGYGHKVKTGEAFGIIDPVTAGQLLIDDVATATDTVRRLVSTPLQQYEFDALVSFVFNVGVSAFAASTMLQKLNAGDRAGAAAEFNRWVYVTIGGSKVVSAGLQNRRAAERQLFQGIA